MLFRSSLLKGCHDLIAPGAEKVTDRWQPVANDDESKNEKICQWEPDLIYRGCMMVSSGSGGPCLRNTEELNRDHPTFLPRILLAISCAIVLISVAASCRSFCIWLAICRRTPSRMLIAS